jgi:hypothetical protein
VHEKSALANFHRKLVQIFLTITETNFTRTICANLSNRGASHERRRPPRDGVTSELPAKKTTPIASTTTPVTIHQNTADMSPQHDHGETPSGQQ